MAVEILTVSLSDESIEKLAQRIAEINSVQSFTQSNPPSSETHRTRSDQVSQPGGDPWGDQPVDDGSWPQGSTTTPPQNQGYQQPPQQTAPQQQPQGNVPTCAHGAMRLVPAGFSQSSGKAYSAFYACPAPRGQECKGNNGRNLTYRA